MNSAARSAPGLGTLNPYMIQQINSASSEKLVLMLYDLGIKSCRNRNREAAARVLVELISALDFTHGDITQRFFDLYRYSLDLVHQNNFEEPLTILQELREVWRLHVLTKNGAE